jgi:hypothetical protein
MRNAVNVARENGYEAVTCGHTHFAEDMVVNGVRYINTGAWTEFPAHYLHISQDNMVLSRVDLPSPDGRGQIIAPNPEKISLPSIKASRSSDEARQGIL